MNKTMNNETKQYKAMSRNGAGKAEVFETVEAKNRKEARKEVARKWEGHWIMKSYWFVKESK